MTVSHAREEEWTYSYTFLASGGQILPWGGRLNLEKQRAVGVTAILTTLIECHPAVSECEPPDTN